MNIDDLLVKLFGVAVVLLIATVVSVPFGFLFKTRKGKDEKDGDDV